MIPGRLRQRLKILRWKPADLADELGRREAEVKAWIEGRADAPLAVTAWIEALVKAHEALPPPGRALAISKTGGDEIEPVEIRLPKADHRTIQLGSTQGMTRRPTHPLATGFSVGPAVQSVPGATSSKGGSSHGSRAL
jgi:hypothetical protein